MPDLRPYPIILSDSIGTEYRKCPMEIPGSHGAVFDSDHPLEQVLLVSFGRLGAVEPTDEPQIPADNGCGEQSS